IVLVGVLKAVLRICNLVSVSVRSPPGPHPMRRPSIARSDNWVSTHAVLAADVHGAKLTWPRSWGLRPTTFDVPFYLLHRAVPR
ncbi:hypothetical protein, partial [Aquabacterium sp. A08]|uniref:hypothetical protein n=1 Tax=Aquabacterium sp. A08 TaxID=2718532 RepID=UPI001AAE2EB6